MLPLSPIDINRRKLWRSNAYTGGLAHSFHIFVQKAGSEPELELEQQAKA